MKTALAFLMLSLPLLACGDPQLADAGDEVATGAEAMSKPTAASVGKSIFFDTRLSEPAGQACSTCHDPAHAFADSRPGPTSEGAVTGRFGLRNTPSISYASLIPAFSAAPGGETGFAGAFFWDGRVPTMEAQAGGPMLNPLEMNNADKATVVNKVKTGPYAASFKKVYGSTVFTNVDTAFAHITEAISAFERVGVPNRFTSKYDAYLAGKATLTPSEAHGLVLFEDPMKGNCASCHLDKPSMSGAPPLFSDFGYDNLGIPHNTASPYYNLPPELNPGGINYKDPGLSAPIHNPRQYGKFKAPSLRNVALTAPYGHNGYFPDLLSIVDFYNTRDVPGKWEAPEVTFAINTADMGNLGLSAQDEQDLVDFMGTLTDGYKPGAARR